MFVRPVSNCDQVAIALADEAIRTAGYPRFRLISRAIRDEQSSAIELTRGARELPIRQNRQP